MPIFLIAGIALMLYGGGYLKNIGLGSANSYGLPDVDPSQQGGGYKTTYDDSFLAASKATGVPFALLKAHAIQESSINPTATKSEPATSTRPASASYGLLQLLWWTGSDRWSKYGFPDSVLNGGQAMFDPDTNCSIAAQLISDNLDSCDGNIRDAINMYNSGVKESVREAPASYVDKVIGYYETISNQESIG